MGITRPPPTSFGMPSITFPLFVPLNLQLCFYFCNVLSADCLFCAFNFFLLSGALLPSPPNVPSPHAYAGCGCDFFLPSPSQSTTKPSTEMWFRVVPHLSTPVVGTRIAIPCCSTKVPSYQNQTPSWGAVYRDHTGKLSITVSIQSSLHSLNKHRVATNLS